MGLPSSIFVIPTKVGLIPFFVRMRTWIPKYYISCVSVSLSERVRMQDALAT